LQSVVIKLLFKKVAATATKLVVRGISLLGMDDSINMATPPDARMRIYVLYMNLALGAKSTYNPEL